MAHGTGGLRKEVRKVFTILIGLVGAFVIYVGVSNGEWGPVGLAVAILLILYLAAYNERQEWKAYRNARDYWAAGGPGKRR